MAKSYTKKIYEEVGSPVDLVIPEGYTEISPQTFQNCTTLKSISIPEGISKIGKSAFRGCSSLLSVDIPGSVTEIGMEAFLYCKSLETVGISEGIIEIGTNAFGGCTSLKRVTIPDSVTKIGSSAFERCTSLYSVKLSDIVTEIGRSVFTGCTSLKSITIPESVTEIGWSAFGCCISLNSITIPESVKHIDGYAFYDCTSLYGVTILNPKIDIKISAFSGCKALTQVNLPKGSTRSKMKNMFADSPWVKNQPISANIAAEQAKKEKLEALAAASASAIVKQFLDQVAPASTTTVVNSDNKTISLYKDLVLGIKLCLSFSVPKKLEEVQQFASSLVEYVKQVRNLFSNCFADSSIECGRILLSWEENNLVMTVKLDRAPTKGGNYVDMAIEDIEVNMFLNSRLQLKKIIEKFDSWVGVKANVYISLKNSLKGCRYRVYLTDFIEAPSNLVFIDSIDLLKSGCFKHTRDVESITISRKLLSNVLSECRSLKEIHVI